MKKVISLLASILMVNSTALADLNDKELKAVALHELRHGDFTIGIGKKLPELDMSNVSVDVSETEEKIFLPFLGQIFIIWDWVTDTRISEVHFKMLDGDSEIAIDCAIFAEEIERTSDQLIYNISPSFTACMIWQKHMLAGDYSDGQTLYFENATRVLNLKTFEITDYTKK